MKNILISIDDSVYSLHAAKTGIILAKKLNASIALIHVVDNRIIMTEGSYTPREVIDSGKIEGEKLLTKIRNMFNCQNAIALVVEGNPGETILEQARILHADTIILGTHGRTGLTRFVMGSVAEDVVRHSSCPVLVVPFKSIENNKQ